MTQMQPSTKQNQNHGNKEEIGDCQGEGVGMEWEGWSGRVGSADENYYIQNGQMTRSYWYSTEKYIQYLVVNHNGKECKK